MLFRFFFLNFCKIAYIICNPVFELNIKQILIWNIVVEGICFRFFEDFSKTVTVRNFSTKFFALCSENFFAFLQ